jgi:formylglycine-generating enzyme required for sulfatase activity
MQALASALVILLALGGIGWAKQDYLREQGYWLAFMHPKPLEAGAERALSPGEHFAECENGCPEMVVVPPGEFLMGSLASMGDEDEHPQHEVVIGAPFALGFNEITFAQWDACVASGACPDVPASDGDQGDNPAVNVSWVNAEKYAAWLSRVTGKSYRLPSEAEWEYAARAGSSTFFVTGDTDDGLAGYAWYRPNSEMHAHPVGKLNANSFGLKDMFGNVWEWVKDCFNPSYAGAPLDGSAWLTGNCDLRIHRGGSWANDSRYLRSADRLQGASGLFGISLGFRVARDLDQ